MARALRLFIVPYDAGRRDVGMGRGPTVLLEEHDLARRLQAAGGEVEVTLVEARGPLEIKRTFELAARLAEGVAESAARGEFPLVLSGNCNSCLGTTAGLGLANVGVVWFDAHADFDTPDDNLSGFFDVFALSILTGSGWRGLRRTIPGFREIDEQRVVLAGVRDLEPYQRERLERSSVDVVWGARVRRDGIERSLGPALDRLAATTGSVYVHVDLDALDPDSEGRANAYAAPGGLRLDDLEWAFDAIFDRFDVAASAVTAYDPSLDADGRMAETATRVIEALATRVDNARSEPRA